MSIRLENITVPRESTNSKTILDKFLRSGSPSGSLKVIEKGCLP